MRLYTIDTGYFKLDGGAMFGVVPKTIWSRLQPADENNLCTWAMRCLLVEDGRKLILIDTGIGKKQDEKFFAHYHLSGNNSLRSSLASHGFSPDDITDVILTHLHFDHCGGCIERDGDKLVPAFRNAIYWSNKKHWNHAVNPNAREKASFLKENIDPIRDCGQLKFVHDEQEDSGKLNTPAWQNGKTPALTEIPFSENIVLRIASGHTASMMLPQIRYKEKVLVFMADLLPGINHIPIPYVMAYDINPLKTLVEKQVFLEEALANDYTLFFEHDPSIECCNLRQTEKGIRQKDCFRLEDL
jgi:glyoxylase-like metal-dependent hydrolase (beta-lactamase superfamily II)